MSFGELAKDEYPFELGVDSRDKTLSERMRTRLASAVSCGVYFCICDWDCAGYAERTSMHWGRTASSIYRWLLVASMSS